MESRIFPLGTFNEYYRFRHVYVDGAITRLESMRIAAVVARL